MHGKLRDEIKKLDEEEKEIAKKILILQNKIAVIRYKANEKLRKLSAIENELLTKIVQVTLFKNHNNINFYSYHNSRDKVYGKVECFHLRWDVPVAQIRQNPD